MNSSGKHRLLDRARGVQNFANVHSAASRHFAVKCDGSVPESTTAQTEDSMESCNGSRSRRCSCSAPKQSRSCVLSGNGIDKLSERVLKNVGCFHAFLLFNQTCSTFLFDRGRD
jgi:hypothetical protein